MKPFRTPGRTFLTGALAVLPLTVTLAVLAWATNFVMGMLGPDSVLGRLLEAVGLAITTSPLFAYLIGSAVLLMAIFGLGLLVQSSATSGLRSAMRSAIEGIPFIGQIYVFSSKFTDMFQSDGGADLETMQPVWVSFGVGGEATLLALMPTAEPVLIEGIEKVGVLVPMAPVPFGGGLVFVPKTWVANARLSVDQLTSIYVSMGLTAPDLTSKRQAKGIRPATGLGAE